VPTTTEATAPAQATTAPPTREQILQAERRRTLSKYTEAQQQAALLLFITAQQMLDTGGGSTCGKLLLGLYNGNRFPFDLTNLRRLDVGRLDAAMTVIQMDASHTWCEIHVLLDAVLDVPYGKSTGCTLELWAYRLGLKAGRCNKQELADLKGRAV